MRSAITILLSLYAIFGFGQFKPRNILEKEFFMHTWKLVEIKENGITIKPAETRILRFTKDSVFISANNQHYAGTWTLKKSQLYIAIGGTSQFNYKWTSIAGGSMWLRTGNDFSRLE